MYLHPWKIILKKTFVDPHILSKLYLSLTAFEVRLFVFRPKTVQKQMNILRNRQDTPPQRKIPLCILMYVCRKAASSEPCIQKELPHAPTDVLQLECVSLWSAGFFLHRRSIRTKACARRRSCVHAGPAGGEAAAAQSRHSAHTRQHPDAILTLAAWERSLKVLIAMFFRTLFNKVWAYVSQTVFIPAAQTEFISPSSLHSFSFMSLKMVSLLKD